MRQVDRLCLSVIDRYRTESKIDKFVNVYHPYNSEFEHNVVEMVISKNKKYSKKNIPIKCEQLKFDSIVPYHINASLSTTVDNKRKFVTANKTGLFKITFDNNSILLVARWLEGWGKNEITKCIVVGDAQTYSNYLKALELEVKSNQKPKNGIFRAYMTQFGMQYLPLDNVLPVSPVIHPKVAEIEKDMKYYFDNVKLFTRFKQSGVRKFMLISEPGTGKSSLFYKIARENEKTKNVVFVTDIEAAASHLKICAKYKVPSIIFIEDADSTLANHNGNSSVLNFLDGVDTPTNPMGSLIIMSTNFPEKIEERILTRPGRIDKIYNFDSLKGDWALECADLYFDKYFDVKTNKTELLPIVDGMTGAQIKELALASMSYASSSQKKIDTTLIKEVKNLFSKNLSEAYKYAEQNSIKKLTKGNGGLGFSQVEY